MTKKLTDDLRKKALQLILDGAKRFEVAEKMGMAYSTWWKYLRDHPDFADAVDNARDAFLDHV